MAPYQSTLRDDVVQRRLVGDGEGLRWLEPVRNQVLPAQAPDTLQAAPSERPPDRPG